jgi:hypothetical protein
MFRNRTQLLVFLVGLAIVLAAAALLVLNVIESGPAALLGIVGISLIATAGRMGSARI